MQIPQSQMWTTSYTYTPAGELNPLGITLTETHRIECNRHGHCTISAKDAMGVRIVGVEYGSLWRWLMRRPSVMVVEIATKG